MIRVAGRNADVRIAWTIVLALAVGGYLTLLVPAARRVRTTESRARDLYHLANRNERVASDAGQLRAASWRVARDVAELAAQRNEAATTLAALRVLRIETDRFHVILAGFGPADRVAASSSESQDVRISLHGSYRAVLSAIADLSKRNVLLEVREVSLSRAAGPFGLPEVDATIRATLYQSTNAIVKEKGYVADASR